MSFRSILLRPAGRLMCSRTVHRMRSRQNWRDRSITGRMFMETREGQARANADPAPAAGIRSSSESHIDPGEKQFHLGARELTGAFRQKVLVEAQGLRNVRHRFFGKPRQAAGQ